MIIVESFGVVASIVSFFFTIFLLAKGKHPNMQKDEGRKYATKLLALTIISGLAVTLLAYHLQKRINTKVIEDVISYESSGVKTIHYKHPFKYTPYLKISTTGNVFCNTGPTVSNQDRFSFDVKLSCENIDIKWIAEGILKN